MRLAAVAIVLPLAGRGSERLADRLETTRGPSLTTHGLRGAARLAERGRLRRRR